jgi:hypothetical protein
MWEKRIEMMCVNGVYIRVHKVVGGKEAYT